MNKEKNVMCIYLTLIAITVCVVAMFVLIYTTDEKQTELETQLRHVKELNYRIEYLNQRLDQLNNLED